MKRRSFIKCAGHAAVAPGILGAIGGMPSTAFASLLKRAASNGKTIVQIFLDGGNDDLGTFFPLAQMSTLNAVRQDLMVPEASLLPLNGVEFGLHPAMPGFQQFFNEGKLAYIRNVSYPEASQSHFLEIGSVLSAKRPDQQPSSGLYGRYLKFKYPEYPVNFPNTDFPDPLGIDAGIPRILFQEPTVGSIGVNVLGELSSTIPAPTYTVPSGVLSPIAEDKIAFIQDVDAKSSAYGQRIASAVSGVTLPAGFPNDFFGAQMGNIARMIAGGIQTPIFLASHGGFDTHAIQSTNDPNAPGGRNHYRQLQSLNNGVTEFYNFLEANNCADNVVVFIMTEFGRRVAQNGSLGTEHGKGAGYMVIGNSVNGGFYGNDPTLPAASDIDLTTTLPGDFHYKQVLTTLLEDWFDENSSDVTSLLLEGQFEKIPLFGNPLSSGSPFSESPFKVYPNPLPAYGTATIELPRTGELVKVDAYSMKGKRIPIYKGRSQVGLGKNTLHWDTTWLNSGHYIVKIKAGNRTYSVKVIKN